MSINAREVGMMSPDSLSNGEIKEIINNRE
jgi:hypothetical protein